MFGTLLGTLPRPPLAIDATREAVLDAVVAAQVDAGLEPVTDGGWPLVPDDPVASWRATADRTDRAVKAVIVGPYTSGIPAGGSIEAVRDLIGDLGAAGCPIVEVSSRRPWRSVRTRRSRRGSATSMTDLLEGLAGPGPAALPRPHLSLAITGGAADAAGSATILGPAYASLAVDLVAGPDNWHLVRATPEERGIVCGALSSRGGIGRRTRDVAVGRGLRSGERGAWARSRRVGDGLVARGPVVAGRADQAGEAGRGGQVAGLPPDERLAAIDPRAIDSRSAALGRYDPADTRRSRRRTGR